MEMFDFGFGPVPAKKHANGGGWIALTAIVSELAFIGPNARVSGNAQVYGDVRVSGDAQVYGDARVYGNAQVSGDAQVSGNARVSVMPIILSGGEYTVTICDAPYICVGCQIATLEMWENGHAPETCPILEAMRPALIALAKIHHNVK